MHRTASCLQRGGVGGKPGMWCVGKNGWFGGNLESLLKRGKCLVVKIQHLAVVFFGGDDVYYIYIYINNWNSFERDLVDDFRWRFFC